MNPESVQLLKNGYARQQQGDFNTAGEIYRQVLERDPHNEMALSLMGVICIYQSQPRAAIEHLQNSLKINPNEPATHVNLGLAFKDLNQFPEARAAFEQSLILNPNQPGTLSNLGNVLAAVDLHEEAIEQFRSALTLDPNFADCLGNLAISLNEVGKTKAGLQAIDLAIKINPKKRLFLSTKGKILLDISQYELAKEILEMAVKIDGDIESRIHLSTALKHLGEERAAVDELNRVLEIDADNSHAHNKLGILHAQLGNTSLAATHFRLALKHSGSHTSSYYQLSRLKDQRLTEKEFAHVQSLLQAGTMPEIPQSQLYFALACELEKRGEHEASLEHMVNGHNIKSRRQPYNAAETIKFIRSVMKVFPVKHEAAAVEADGLPIPVFIVGMPRSGTTLTEQVISSHSQITAAGELSLISEIGNQSVQMTGNAFPESVENLSAEQIHKLRRTYLDRLVKRFGHRRYISDKNPLNYKYVGFIATVFPEAKIIYCKRNAMDNCVSIFRLSLNKMHSYSHSLPALGHYYRQQEKLMDYWMANYPAQILQVRYEDTVENLEQQARRMLNFINVGFEEQVLSFFDNERIVMTPSAEQVRQPIYKDSVNSWQKFGEGLQPLIDALQMDAR